MKTHYRRIHEFNPPVADMTERCRWCGVQRTIVARIVEAKGGFSFDNERMEQCIARPFYEYNFVEKLFLRLLRGAISVVLWMLKKGASDAVL